jgi:prevent-host-death family protein
MTRVGIRELKLHMSALLRRAAAGEVIEVTEYGRPMVRLVPALPEGGLEQLIAEGGVDLPTEAGDVLDIEPLPPTPGVPPASELLARIRADER